jgi:putative phosphoesterase
MLVGIVSDIHGNLAAFEQAVQALSSTVDEVLVAGDAFSDHAFSNGVIEGIRKAGARYVLGNHELSLLSPAGGAARSSPKVDRGHLQFVADQPTEVRAAFGEKRLLMVHGSPWQPYGQYLSPASPLFDRCDDLDVDYLILGHSHEPFRARRGRTLVVNPGSLGRSDHPSVGDTVTYAILDTDADHADICSFDNPLLVARR